MVKHHRSLYDPFDVAKKIVYARRSAQLARQYGTSSEVRQWSAREGLLKVMLVKYAKNLVRQLRAQSMKSDAQVSSLEEAFSAWLKTLPTPAAENIRSSKERNESLTFNAFKHAFVLGQLQSEPKTVQELQAAVARYQQQLILKMCGDPVGGVGLKLASDTHE